MAPITINEGLAWLKTLKKRHEELLALRNDNAHRPLYGAEAVGSSADGLTSADHDAILYR